MKTVDYRGDGLSVRLELGTPTIGTGVLQSLAVFFLRNEAKTDVAMGQIVVFGDMLKYTRCAEGLPFALPTRNSTSDEMLAAFAAWLDLPEALGDLWQAGVDELKDAFLADQQTVMTTQKQDVLTSTNGLLSLPPSASSAKASRRRSRGTKSPA